MGEGEADIGPARFGKTGSTSAGLLGGGGLFAAEHFQSFPCERFVQGLFVGKMPVDGRRRNPHLARQFAQRRRLPVGAFESPQTFEDKRLAQIAVMIGFTRS